MSDVSDGAPVPSPWEDFDYLVPPLKGWKTPDALTLQDVVMQLNDHARSAFAHEDARPAAIGFVVAVGNYIQAYGGPNYYAILKEAEDLLQKLDPIQGKRWRYRL